MGNYKKLSKASMAALLSQFKVVKTEEHINNQGYGYLSAEMYRHDLEDGTYIIAGWPFDPGFACGVPIFNHYNSKGELITRYAN